MGGERRMIGPREAVRSSLVVGYVCFRKLHSGGRLHNFVIDGRLRLFSILGATNRFNQWGEG